MEPTLFLKWVNKFFRKITIKVVQTLNGEDRQPSYLYKEVLQKDYSVDGTWESVSSDNTNVAADVVAMDSSLPLKTRPSIKSATGEIPKMGMELKLNEKQLTALDILVKTGASDAQIVDKLFDDTIRAIKGIPERIEKLFLQGLSSGVALADDDNVGTGIRVDYGYKPKNKTGTSGAIWSTPGGAGVKPVTDINNLLAIAEALGQTPGVIYMSKVSFNQARATDEGKSLYATSIGNFGSTKPIPTAKQFQEVLASEFERPIRLIDRTVTTEIDGVKTATKPWAAGQVILAPAGQLGSLVWAELAEMNHPAANVTYSTVDDFILVSKYRLNRPSLGEFTSSQARVLPVIANTDAIFVLDTLTANV